MPDETYPTTRPRVGVIGLGRIGSDYLGILKESDSLELVGVCDTDPVRLGEVADATGCTAYAGAREMCRDAKIDAGIVLTPPITHEQIVLDLLSERVHVLCEKPLAVTSSAAGRMLHTALRSEVLLMMASKFRYVPDLIDAQRMIAGGAIGTPIMFDNAFCSSVDMTGRWNAELTISGGGVLIDNGCHSVDIVRMLLGPIVRVFAHFGRRVQRIRVEDSVHVVFETARACVGSIDLSWSIEKTNDHFVSIQGTGGVIQIGWRSSRYRATGEAEWTTFGTGYDKRAAIAAQLDNFAAVIQGRAEPLVGAGDAVASVRAIEAAYRSARVGRWVPVQGS